MLRSASAPIALLAAACTSPTGSASWADDAGAADAAPSLPTADAAHDHAAPPPADGDAASETPPDPGPKKPVKPAPGSWIAISAGSFWAGAPDDEACNGSSNQVLHHVTLSRAFELTATEVTFDDYLEVFGTHHPSFAGCASCPVPLLSWHGAAALCNAYSEYAGLVSCYACQGDGNQAKCTQALDPRACSGYRLPTEAEWEYAYRAGSASPIYSGTIENCSGLDSGLDAIAWYLYNASGGTHPVAGKQPNAWGLFDMSGNLWEWTHDGYLSDRSALPETDPIAAHLDGLRVMRGGSYNCVPEELRAAHRSGVPGEISGNNVGVRCARTLM
jgi:formylglycine-generating enzyme required for sulfatase activity